MIVIYHFHAKKSKKNLTLLNFWRKHHVYLYLYWKVLSIKDWKLLCRSFNNCDKIPLNPTVRKAISKCFIPSPPANSILLTISEILIKLILDQITMIGKWWMLDFLINKSEWKMCQIQLLWCLGNFMP